jgi:ATP-dependent helicase HrpA
MNPYQLPVYEQREKILSALQSHQVIVVESPTGSGKTTQIPLILHEAGYTRNGIVGVTQPRRIAALSVSEFMARQINTTIPRIIGYVMRFEDRTDDETVIKVMTDGILLQELKSDRLLSRYSVLMIDEAHERSLNIDFILGMLKGIIAARPEFRVIVSSATINVETFSQYFNGCPIVSIDAPMYPVEMVYAPPEIEGDSESLLLRIKDIVAGIMQKKLPGDILIFLPGELAIKDCVKMLADLDRDKELALLPLYARLAHEDQVKVFDDFPGLRKVIVSTNIAETSITIDGVRFVIDSGRGKVNFYSPKTFTESLVEVPVSTASCNQRRCRRGAPRPAPATACTRARTSRAAPPTPWRRSCAPTSPRLSCAWRSWASMTSSPSTSSHLPARRGSGLRWRHCSSWTRWTGSASSRRPGR